MVKKNINLSIQDKLEIGKLKKFQKKRKLAKKKLSLFMKNDWELVSFFHELIHNHTYEEENDIY